jgi:hypothetical protein
MLQDSQLVSRLPVGILGRWMVWWKITHQLRDSKP